MRLDSHRTFHSHLQVPRFDLLAAKALYPLRFLVGTGFNGTAGEPTTTPEEGKATGYQAKQREHYLNGKSLQVKSCCGVTLFLGTDQWVMASYRRGTFPTMRLPALPLRRLVGLAFATASACAQQSAPPAATPYDIDLESGLGAARSFELPAFGQAWKDGPEYKVGNRPLWRLNCFGNQYLHNHSYGADSATLYRSARGGSLRYDSERHGFVRPAQLQPPTAPNISGFQNIYDTPLPEAEANCRCFLFCPTATTEITCWGSRAASRLW
jgi:hypothetical protein